MDKKKLMRLINKDEGTKLDFKQQLEIDTESARKELAKDVCAIANSKGGRGYIVFGIEDKTKRIIGIDRSKFPDEEQLQQIISSRSEPPIPIRIDSVEVEDKILAVLTIYDGDQKPYQLRENGAFYIRRGSTTDTMRKQELVSAFHENLNLNIETCPILKSDIRSLNMRLIDQYFGSKGVEVSDENKLFLMESASIITKEKEGYRYYITLGGLLVFCDINNVYIPHNMIRIVNKVNKSLSDIIVIQGNLLHMLDECERILLEILPHNYPSYAVFEGVKNAVLYRDYTIFYKEIEVIVDFNSISVISPGDLIKGERRVQREKSNYFKRNMWIYEKLITLDRKNRFIRSGRGFSRMKKAFKKYGKVIFINSNEYNYFKVIYPGINSIK
jgi:predicted HTH transcriptional regulator